MDYDTFKMIHSELIMSVQYIEQDLRIIYSTIKSGDYQENYAIVNAAPLGKLLSELQEVDEESGLIEITPNDYKLLDEIRKIRNYWCHQCYLDFHYIENRDEHEIKFQEVAERLHFDELRVFELYQKIEKLRKNIVEKYKCRRQ